MGGQYSYLRDAYNNTSGGTSREILKKREERGKVFRKRKPTVMRDLRAKKLGKLSTLEQ